MLLWVSQLLAEQRIRMRRVADLVSWVGEDCGVGKLSIQRGGFRPSVHSICNRRASKQSSELPPQDENQTMFDIRRCM